MTGGEILQERLVHEDQVIIQWREQAAAAQAGVQERAPRGSENSGGRFGGRVGRDDVQGAGSVAAPAFGGQMDDQVGQVI